VLQFGLGRGRRNPHRPENHERNSVVYTGTHDNDTVRGWWETLPRGLRARTGLDEREPAWSMLELAWGSRAALAIAPLQDVLGLGSDARMNLPGIEKGNWRWRYEKGALTGDLAARLRDLTVRTGRA
jgi:4-alpha-glucanotransferase